jgi:predicted NBD/HSP70 family sugar kinase
VLRDRGEALTTADVFAAAARDDRLACGILDAVVEDVAMTVVALAAITDPELVILDGAVGHALAPWSERLVELVERALPAPPALVISTLGQDATTLGAVAAALELAAGHRPADLAPASVAVHVGPGDRAAVYLRRERRR